MASRKRKLSTDADGSRAFAALRAGGLKLSFASARSIIAALDKHAASDDRGQDTCSVDVRRWSAPVHGSVMKFLEVPVAGGGLLKLPIVDPAALLLFFAKERPAFADFLQKYLGNKVSSKVVVWTDDTTPGQGVLNRGVLASCFQGACLRLESTERGRFDAHVLSQETR